MFEHLIRRKEDDFSIKKILQTFTFPFYLEPHSCFRIPTPSSPKDFIVHKTRTPTEPEMHEIYVLLYVQLYIVFMYLFMYINK